MEGKREENTRRKGKKSLKKMIQVFMKKKEKTRPLCKVGGEFHRGREMCVQGGGR